MALAAFFLGGGFVGSCHRPPLNIFEIAPEDRGIVIIVYSIALGLGDVRHAAGILRAVRHDRGKNENSCGSKVARMDVHGLRDRVPRHVYVSIKAVLLVMGLSVSRAIIRRAPSAVAFMTCYLIQAFERLLWRYVMVRSGSILLKKSLTAVLTWFSGVFVPLTDARERFVGRSEGSILSPAN